MKFAFLLAVALGLGGLAVLWHNNQPRGFIASPNLISESNILGM